MTVLSPNLGENVVSLNWFFKLKEIDSVSKMKINHLKAIAEQDDRLSKLNTRLEETNLQTVKIKQEMFTLQQNMYEIEQNLKLYQKQRQNLMGIGESGEKYNAQIDEAESQGLMVLEAIEKHDQELKDLRQFEAGVTKTIAEITKEALEIKTKEKEEIKNLDMRLCLLEEELPSNFRELLRNVTAKNLAHGAFTRTDNGSCYFCRYKISRLDESEIDVQHQLKQCPQCERIFLPYGS